uniref:26S proteasome non-ATPase regulatory subunit 5 n=1 Tax=Rhabditophanes sp. KR3021 TaxID=114890 RepID=A0AC35U1V0_9BILA
MMLVNPEESDFSLESPIWTRKGIEDLLSTFRLNPNFGVAANILDKLPLEYVSLIPRDIIPELQDLITELFRSFTIELFIEKYQLIFLNFINKCPSDMVRTVLINFILPNLNEKTVTHLKSRGQAIIVAITRRLSDCTCSEIVAEAVRPFVDCPEVQLELAEGTKHEDSLIRFKYYAVAEAVLMKSPTTHFQAISPMMKGIMGEIRSGDQLTIYAALNMLAEIIPERAQVIKYYIQMGIPDLIFECMSGGEEEFEETFQFAGIIKFLSFYAATDYSVLVEYSYIVDILVKMVISYEEYEVTKGYLALGSFAAAFSTPQSKSLLMKGGLDESVMESVVESYTKALIRGSNSLKLRSLDALSLFFRDCSEDGEEGLESVFNLFNSSFFVRLLSNLKTPITEIRMGTQLLVTMFLQYEWGFKCVYGYDFNFFKVFLDRSTDQNAEGMQNKYDILQILVTKYGTKLKADDLTLAETYLRNGAVYHPAPPEVAMEM